MRCVYGGAGGRAGVRYVIDKFSRWIVYQILLPMVLRCVRFERARAPLKMVIHPEVYFFGTTQSDIPKNLEMGEKRMG